MAGCEVIKLVLRLHAIVMFHAYFAATAALKQPTYVHRNDHHAQTRVCSLITNSARPSSPIGLNPFPNMSVSDDVEALPLHQPPPRQALRDALEQARRSFKTTHDDLVFKMNRFLDVTVRKQGMDAYIFLYTSPTHTRSLPCGFFKRNRQLNNFLDAFMFNARRGGRYVEEYQQDMIHRFMQDICDEGIITAAHLKQAMQYLYKGALSMHIICMTYCPRGRRLDPGNSGPLRH